MSTLVPYLHFAIDVSVICSQRFTLGVTPADLLVANMAASSTVPYYRVIFSSRSRNFSEAPTNMKCKLQAGGRGGGGQADPLLIL